VFVGERYSEGAGQSESETEEEREGESERKRKGDCACMRGVIKKHRKRR